MILILLGADFDCVNDYGSDLSSDGPEEYSRNAVENLFGQLRQLLKDIHSLQTLAFSWCDDMLNEMGHALVKVERSGEEFNIRSMWDRLHQEAEQKVNGAGFPCACRRQCCLLTAPDERPLLFSQIQRWRCTWNETWREGI